MAKQTFGHTVILNSRFRVPFEKNYQSVVSPYISTVNIFFIIVDTLRVQKNIF